MTILRLLTRLLEILIEALSDFYVSEIAKAGEERKGYLFKISLKLVSPAGNWQFYGAFEDLNAAIICGFARVKINASLWPPESDEIELLRNNLPTDHMPPGLLSVFEETVVPFIVMVSDFDHVQLGRLWKVEQLGEAALEIGYYPVIAVPSDFTSWGELKRSLLRSLLNNVLALDGDVMKAPRPLEGGLDSPAWLTYPDEFRAVIPFSLYSTDYDFIDTETCFEDDTPAMI